MSCLKSISYVISRGMDGIDIIMLSSILFDSDVAVGVRDMIELRRRKHIERQREQQERSRKMKKLRLGDEFDVNENETMKRKTEDQKERDRLMFEMQNFGAYWQSPLFFCRCCRC